MMCHRIGFPPISTIGLGRHGLLADAGAHASGEDHGLHGVAAAGFRVAGPATASCMTSTM